MKLMVTAHRPPRLNNEWNINGPCCTYIRSEIYKIFEREKPSLAITGMALGGDMIFASVALQYSVPILAAVPFEGQEKRWTEEHQKWYNYILNHKNTTIVIPEIGLFSKNPYINRDFYMANECDKCVAVYDQNKGGGTYLARKQVLKLRKPVFDVNPGHFNL